MCAISLPFKKLSYILTYFNVFAAFYIIAAYAFSKNFIMRQYHIKTSDFGYIEGFMLFCQLFGTAIYVAVPTVTKYPVFYCSLTTLICCLTYLLIIAGSLLENPSPVILWVASSVAGVCRSLSEPLCLNIVYKARKLQEIEGFMETPKEQALNLALWGSSIDTGTIFGFLLSNLIVYTMNLDWKFSLLSAIALNLLSVFLFAPIYSYIDRSQVSESEEEASNLAIRRFMIFMFTNPFRVLVLILSCAYESLIFGFSLILPTYFYSLNYQGSQGNLSALFSGFLFIGNLMAVMIEILISEFRKSSKQTELQSGDFRNQNQPEPEYIPNQTKGSDQQTLNLENAEKEDCSSEDSGNSQNSEQSSLFEVIVLIGFAFLFLTTLCATIYTLNVPVHFQSLNYNILIISFTGLFLGIILARYPMAVQFEIIKTIEEEIQFEEKQKNSYLEEHCLIPERSLGKRQNLTFQRNNQPHRTLSPNHNLPSNRVSISEEESSENSNSYSGTIHSSVHCYSIQTMMFGLFDVFIFSATTVFLILSHIIVDNHLEYFYLLIFIHVTIAFMADIASKFVNRSNIEELEELRENLIIQC